MCLYLLSDFQCSLTQRFGLLVFASFAIKNSQVVEGCCHSWVILPQRLLSDGQGIIQKVSRFFVLVLVPVEQNRAELGLENISFDKNTR